MATLPPVHPGEVLLEDFVKPLGLSQCRVAKDLGVSPMRVSQIVHGKRAITADTAMRLAHYFGTSAAVWMRLQARYDLEVAENDPRRSDSRAGSPAPAVAARGRCGGKRGLAGRPWSLRERRCAPPCGQHGLSPNGRGDDEAGQPGRPLGHRCPLQ